MKNTIIIIAVISILFSLIGCQSKEETNLDLNDKVKELESEIAALKEENNNLIEDVTKITNEKKELFNENKALEKQQEELEKIELKNNELIVKKRNVEMYIIDGIYVKIPDELPLLDFNDEIYIPAKHVADFFGEEYMMGENSLYIPGSPYSEDLVLTENLIKLENLTFDSIKALLGEPKSINEYINEAHGGGTEIKVRYDSSEFVFIKHDNTTEIKNFQIYEPIFSTQRGITVGSSKREVEEKYGKFFMKIIEPKEKWYTSEKQGIWFEFEGDYVSGIGVWLYYE